MEDPLASATLVEGERVGVRVVGQAEEVPEVVATITAPFEQAMEAATSLREGVCP